jgi:hypothetical protein
MRALSLGVKWQSCEASHQPPVSVGGKKKWVISDGVKKMWIINAEVKKNGSSVLRSRKHGSIHQLPNASSWYSV